MNISVVRAVSLESLTGLSESELKQSQLPVGYPFLVSGETQEILEPVFQFLWEQHRNHSRRYVANTALAEADDLRDWYQYLWHFNLAWDQVERGDLENYVYLMQTLVSPRTNEAYANKTIRRRIGTVLEFYRYFNSRGCTAVDVGDVETDGRYAIDQNALAHIRKKRTARRNELMPKGQVAIDDEVRGFNKRQYRLVAQALGPLPGQDKNDLRPVRNRLWAEVCLHTGMRPDEPTQLTIHSIMELSPEDPGNPAGLTFLRIVGKGNKVRKVELPNAVLNWLHWYINHERKTDIAEGRRRGIITGRDPVALFVNSTASRHNAGKPAQYGSFHDAFHQAVIAAAAGEGQSAGLLRTVTKVNPETQQSYVEQVPAFSPHCLRHTYTVWSYLAEKQSGNSEPWKNLQVRLGHSSLETTINTYLRVASEFEAQLSDRAAGFLTDMLSVRPK
ncbi:MAG: tyrosine-type recombinase/integrase [Azonexaceae bacterium]|nr:tyrosine-type recombinase/integrase [Azonexaceae bacterium]